MSAAPRTLVLGHRGMLGRAVVAAFRERGFTVSTTEARDPDGDLVGEVARSTAHAVVNCIGGRLRAPGGLPELFATNALLPQRLAASLGRDRLLVQASSDGVFDGRHGGYALDQPTNATDPYGLSKRMGELAVHLGRVAVIRCSIIGLEAGTPRSLLGWFLSQTRGVTGYTDHLWNGITTLTWARIAADLVQSKVAPGIHQPACARPVTKYELLAVAGRVFAHDVPIEPAQSGAPFDRTLIPDIPCPPIEDQIVELRAWQRRQLDHADFDPHSNI